MKDQDRLIVTVRFFSSCVSMDRAVLVCICASFSDAVLFDFQALVSANFYFISMPTKWAIFHSTNNPAWNSEINLKTAESIQQSIDSHKMVLWPKSVEDKLRNQRESMNIFSIQKICCIYWQLYANISLCTPNLLTRSRYLRLCCKIHCLL